ncbi:YoaK family protein [Pedobacter sp. AW31-3R]|uniref:YoaK family protein n=1 Tax=Pedobacter sp. AW31-3R TaxID=3445781 RepID=UPI003FA14B34
MEDHKQHIWFVTLMLTAAAGFCDTVTFVAADRIFSAHVTGNFITFAYQMIKGSEADAWIKLLTFPVFVAAVMLGGWIGQRSVRRPLLLFCEALLLIFAGVLAYFSGYLEGAQLSWPMYVVTMLVVVAMGFQNAFGKLFSKATYGPTTMMTGNVTQASLDLCSLIGTRLKDVNILASFKNQLITIGGFLAGCLLGAFFGKQFGLVAVVLPGLAMAVCYLYTKDSAASS